MMKLEAVKLSTIIPYERNAKKKADLKRTLETLLQSEVSNHKMKELLVSLGYEPTNETALVLVVLQKSLNGDMRAVTQVRSFLQEDDSSL